MHTVVFGVGGLRISRSKEINKKSFHSKRNLSNRSRWRNGKQTLESERTLAIWIVDFWAGGRKLLWYVYSLWKWESCDGGGVPSATDPDLDGDKKKPKPSWVALLHPKFWIMPKKTLKKITPLTRVFRAWDPVPSTKLSFVIFRDCLWFFVLRKNRPVQPPGAFLDWNGVDL